MFLSYYDIAVLTGPIPPDDESAWELFEAHYERVLRNGNFSPAECFLTLAQRLEYRCRDRLDDFQVITLEMQTATAPNWSSDLFFISTHVRDVPEVLPVILENAHALGLTVLDVQTDRVYRPHNERHAVYTCPNPDCLFATSLASLEAVV